MNIPTSTFLNLPENFLATVFSLVGYIFENFESILILIIGLGIAFSFLGLIISIFK